MIWVWAVDPTNNTDLGGKKTAVLEVDMFDTKDVPFGRAAFLYPKRLDGTRAIPHSLARDSKLISPFQAPSYLAMKQRSSQTRSTTPTKGVVTCWQEENLTSITGKLVPR